MSSFKIENQSKQTVVFAVAYKYCKDDLIAEGWQPVQGWYRVPPNRSERVEAEDAADLHLRVEQSRRGEVTFTDFKDFLWFPTTQVRFTVSKVDNGAIPLRWGDNLEKRDRMAVNVPALPHGWSMKRFFRVGQGYHHAVIDEPPKEEDALMGWRSYICPRCPCRIPELERSEEVRQGKATCCFCGYRYREKDEDKRSTTSHSEDECSTTGESLDLIRLTALLDVLGSARTQLQGQIAQNEESRRRETERQHHEHRRMLRAMVGDCPDCPCPGSTRGQRQVSCRCRCHDF